MTFKRIDEALKAMDDRSHPELQKVAREYLMNLEDPEDIRRLVAELQNDNFSIRWEAAHVLSMMGEKAFPALLQALMDPKLVGMISVRNGISHILHANADPHIRILAEPLLAALKGPAPDIRAMVEAHHLFQKYLTREPAHIYHAE